MTDTVTDHQATVGHWEPLLASDGHRLSAWSAGADGAGRPGLVVLQEIFGVNAHIREVCGGFAGRGFNVVAPALFDRTRTGVALGYGDGAVDTGRRLRAAIAWDAVLLDVQAAIDSVRSPGGTAVLGYCWGGTLAFLAATRLAGVDCAVGYYGGQTVPFAHERARVPVLLHFGTLDPRIPEADRELIRLHNPQIEIHLFPADHGFNCDHREEWHAASAARALALTLDFLGRYLPVAPAPHPVT